MCKNPPKKKKTKNKSLWQKVYKNYLQAVILAKGVILVPAIQGGQTFALFASVTLKMYKMKHKMI